MKNKLYTVAILAIIVLMGMANDPSIKVTNKSDSVPAVPDTLTVSELKKQIAGVLSDSTAVPDSLLFKEFADLCNSNGYNMPVFIPDEELTASMPQVKPGNVDPGILIPGFMECLNGLKERKKE